jgi:hypothetical protein
MARRLLACASSRREGTALGTAPIVVHLFQYAKDKIARGDAEWIAPRADG